MQFVFLFRRTDKLVDTITQHQVFVEWYSLFLNNFLLCLGVEIEQIIGIVWKIFKIERKSLTLHNSRNKSLAVKVCRCVAHWVSVCVCVCILNRCILFSQGLTAIFSLEWCLVPLAILPATSIVFSKKNEPLEFFTQCDCVVLSLNNFSH